MAGNSKVEFYGLSTCGWCKKTKQWLDDNRIDYESVYVDLTQGEERERIKDRVLQFVSRLSFPVVIVNDGARVIQGYKVEELEECLG